ncbi:hypothetical protein [Thiocystis violacea]|uniref:hypothetical protein n=1 Tax=Thiocystis violacea TaxID=13725 RepID=UPI001A931299|nr:hypothetical protein [Thiocystis violacea]MBK1718854.1 hypothetical protein [Thiocystis violacea]
MTDSRLKAGLFCLTSILCQPLYGETIRLTDPVWKEVPGTNQETDDEDFNGAVHIEMSGLTRRGEILEFDVAAPDNSYSRMEVDCAQRRFRTIRMGDFPSQHSIQFVRTEERWKRLDGPNGNATVKRIVSFICRR